MLKSQLEFLGSRRLPAGKSANANPSRFAILSTVSILCYVLLGAAPCRGQDVAQAARQERARKASESAHAQHVYTNDDLRRVQILTPEDRARVEAKRAEQNAPGAKPVEKLDAKELPTQVPLGDVARRLKEEKEVREMRRAAHFHLPFGTTALASPIAPPRFLSREAVRGFRVKRVDPFAKRVGAAVMPPSTPNRSLPRPAPILRAVVPRPSAPRKYAEARVRPESPMLRAVVVQRGDSMWKIARRWLGKGSRWHELLAVNPGIAKEPERIEAGTGLYVPMKEARRRLPSKIKVLRGDSLSKIAQRQYGRAAVWRCLARANPQIQLPDLIYEGQELSLPSFCGP